MNIGWPAAIVIVSLVFAVMAYITSVMATRGSIAMEEAKAKNGAHYQTLSADFEQLAKETRDIQAAMQTDIARIKISVEAMETMMREVG